MMELHHGHYLEYSSCCHYNLQCRGHRKLTRDLSRLFMQTGNNVLKNQLASQLLETGFATTHAWTTDFMQRVSLATCRLFAQNPSELDFALFSAKGIA